jgi:hypothetical protein
MKIFLSILITGIAATLLVACTMQTPSTTEIIVLFDITDAQLAQPNPDEILALCNLQNKWDGLVFRFIDLTDVSYNRISVAKLETKNEWLSNEMEQDKEIKSFKNEVLAIMANRKNDIIGKNNSSIYLPIASELNRLSKVKTGNKLLIIYSDLMENTENLSFYRKSDFSLLKENPKQVQEQLEKLATLNSLSGIEAWFIYQPSETKSDQDFQIVSGFYKKLLEDKGAKVTISANLTL